MLMTARQTHPAFVVEGARAAPAGSWHGELLFDWNVQILAARSGEGPFSLGLRIFHHRALQRLRKERRLDHRNYLPAQLRLILGIPV